MMREPGHAQQQRHDRALQGNGGAGDFERRHPAQSIAIFAQQICGQRNQNHADKALEHQQHGEQL